MVNDLDKQTPNEQAAWFCITNAMLFGFNAIFRQDLSIWPSLTIYVVCILPGAWFIRRLAIRQQAERGSDGSAETGEPGHPRLPPEQEPADT